MNKLLNTNFWYIQSNSFEPLNNNISCDVLIVGGGMAGLSAAYAFNKKGLKVVLIEKHFCGSGASGKSSGFITPDSEFALRDFDNLYGADKAREIWQFVTSGVDFIKSAIINYNINCDYLPLDTVVFASTRKSFEKDIKREHNIRLKLGYESVLYPVNSMSSLSGVFGYCGAIRYSDTFAINAYRFCQEMKLILKKEGVSVYEDSPAIEIGSNFVNTPKAKIKSKYIVLAVDRSLPDLSILKSSVYHVQTYLLLSSPLTEKETSIVFPDKPFMAWDTDLIYNYFRLTKDRRLLVGGSNLLYTYASSETYNNKRVATKLLNYAKERFPMLDINFEYFWPGMLGISKDILPLAGRLNDNPNIYVISAATGLPWAAALGLNSAENLINGNTTFESYFNPERNFFVGPILQKLIGKKLSFAISNFMNKNSL